MAGIEVRTEGDKENNSLLMCYDKRAIDQIIYKVTDCMDKHVEDTLITTEDVKDKFQARFVELYREVLGENIQVSDETTMEADHSSQGSTQSGGSVVNEMREKHYNEVLVQELDKAILTAVKHRKDMPPVCVKQMAKQCAYERTAESKREVRLEPKDFPVIPDIEGRDYSQVTENIVQNFSSMSTLSMSFPQAIEDVSDLETVFDMQSSIGYSTVDHLVFGSHQKDTVMIDSIQGGDGDKIKLNSLETGFMLNE